MAEIERVRHMKKLGIYISVFALSACATTEQSHRPASHTHPRPPTVEEDLLPRSMCSAVSYEEDHDRWLSTARSIREFIEANGISHTTDSASDEGGTVSTNTQPTLESPGHANNIDPSRRSPEYYGDPSQVQSALYLVSQFEAELDGSYDSVVQNCRFYNACMIHNDYDEDECTQSAGMWESSQVRFHRLADRMSQVRERVANIGSHSGHAHRGNRDRNSGEQNYRSTQIGPFSVTDE
jgi:hypothetical protein